MTDELVPLCSILTSDFYGLCFGLGLFGYSPYWLYVRLPNSSHSFTLILTSLTTNRQFVAYPMVLIGLIVYFLVARPESTAVLEVEARGNQAAREEVAGKRKVVGDSRF